MKPDDDPDRAPAFPKHGHDLVGVIVFIDPTFFTSCLPVHSGPYYNTFCHSFSLLYNGFPLTFIEESALKCMKHIGAATGGYEIDALARMWGGFGKPFTLLSTYKYVRLSVQCFHNDTPTTTLAVWAYIVPMGTMHHPILS